MFSKRKKIKSVSALVVSVALAGAILTGCGGDDQQGPPQGMAAQVKVIQAMRQDTPLSLEYAGQIVGKDEVKVQSRVSGTIVEKFVNGGDYVVAGQPLYRIDSRQYESQLYTAQANYGQAMANLNLAKVNLARYEQLLNSAAISQQVYDNQAASTDALDAAAASAMAQVKLAQENLDDCIVYAPMSGKLGVDDVAVGTYAVQGNTPLVTIGNDNPIFVQFSLSENEYLRYANMDRQADTNLANVEVQITLSDGTAYPIAGHIVQVDRAINNNSGSVLVKAVVENPEGLLVPGMFARAKIVGDVAKGAVLVPQRAVQQLLGKSFVMTVQDGKSKAINIELGEKVGSYYIVTKGLTGAEEVVVEGLTTLAEGMPVAVTRTTVEEMGFALTDAEGSSGK